VNRPSHHDFILRVITEDIALNIISFEQISAFNDFISFTSGVSRTYFMQVHEPAYSASHCRVRAFTEPLGEHSREDAVDS